MKARNVSLLSNIGSPVFGQVINEFIKQGVKIDSVIFDDLVTPKEYIKVWNERTAGNFPVLPMSDFEGLNIPCFFVKNHSSAKTVKLVKSGNIDLLINAGTPRILKHNILSSPNIGVLNCHPGSLTRYRGCTAVEWAIFEDEKIVNTVHLMTEEIDQGPIVLESENYFSKGDSYSDIRSAVYRDGYKVLAQAVLHMMNTDKNWCEADYPKSGRSMDVIESDKMEIVYEKIRNNNYKYQL